MALSVTLRASRFVTALSTALCGLAILLFVGGYKLSPWEYRLSFGDSFHVGVWARGGLDSRIVFFNDAEYGPYRGSIIGLVGSNGSLYPPLDRDVRFGDTWGVYYRYFQRGGGTLWTLMVSLWYPIALFAILPASRLLSPTFRRRTTGFLTTGSC